LGVEIAYWALNGRIKVKKSARNVEKGADANSVFRGLRPLKEVG